MFRTEAPAKKVFSDAMGVNGPALFKDDFGIELWVDPRRCALILTNAHASAAFSVALNSANESAMRAYNLPSGAMAKGSSMQ